MSDPGSTEPPESAGGDPGAAGAGSDTVVFIPAWNEEQNLPAVLGSLEAALPGVDVLVVDDGSTDRTAEVAREGGATVHSLGANRGLAIGIAEGYRWALDHGYAYCGRVDADGQHPAHELARLLELVRSDECDVAVGSRFVSGDGYAPYRYRPSGARRLGTALLRRAMKLVLRRPFGDATSGLYAVNAKALPLLAEPFTTGAPEVEALIRLHEADLRVREVPVDMAERASGESKLRGSKAVKLVLTVVSTLLLAKFLRARRR
jgi:glycosyltransferase involved in cell wall biosynthesis